MTVDREKVINGLECCSVESECAKGTCPYYDDYLCSTHIAADALALLREQEAVEPTKQHIEKPNVDQWYCGECGNWIGKTFAYCPWCGKAVKRDA